MGRRETPTGFPPGHRILTESDSDTPHVSILASRIIEYMAASPKHGLIEACRRAYRELLQQEPNGKLNLIMSNGHLSFCFHSLEAVLFAAPGQERR